MWRVVALLAVGACAATLYSPAIASADPVTYTQSPVGQIANGLGNSTQIAQINATLVPGRSPYSPPSGAPSYWTGQAEGSVWSAAEQIEAAPPARYWTGTTLLSAGALAPVAFTTGLWIGNAINRHFIFGGSPPATPASGLVTSLSSDWKMQTIRHGSESATAVKSNPAIPDHAIVAMICDAFIGTCPGFRQEYFQDISQCSGGYTIGTNSYSSSTHVCGFNTDEHKSDEIQSYNTAATLVATGFWHYTTEGGLSWASGAPNALSVYATEADYEKWLQVSPDPTSPTVSQPGDVTPGTLSGTIPSGPSTWTPNTSPTALQTQTAARSELDDCLLRSLCGGIERTNCQLDSTYCPGAQNDPTVITSSTLQIPAPQLNETYTDYLSRLRTLGLVGAATLVADSVDHSGAGFHSLATYSVTDQRTSTTYTVGSWPGTDPTFEKTDKVTVVYQAPAGTGGSSCGSTSGSPCYSSDVTPPDTGSGTALHWPSIVSPCDKFPFGVFCWVGGALADISGADATPPSVTLPSMTIPNGSDVFGGSGSWDSPEITWSVSEIPSGALAAFYVIAAAIAFFVWFFGLWFVGSRMVVGRGVTLEGGSDE